MRKSVILAITLKFWYCNLIRALKKERVSLDDAGKIRKPYSMSIRRTAVKEEDGNMKPVL